MKARTWTVSAVALGAAALLSVVPLRGARAQHHHGDAGAPVEEPDPSDETESDGGVVNGPAVEVRSLVADAAVPVATGRGVLVTADEVYHRVADAPEPVQRAWAANPALMDELVDRLVADRLMANEARRLGLERDPAVRAAVERALVARLRATVINGIANDGSAVTADDVRGFYNTHASRFHIPERRRVRVIHVATRRDAEQVLRLALRQRRHRAVNDFRDLARQYNTDPDLVRTTGDLRDVTAVQADLEAALRDAIFAIDEPGDVLDRLVPGSWHGVRGFFVVRLVARRAPIDRTLAESSDWIRQRLVLERRVQAERALVERLAREAGVTRVHADRVVRVVAADAGF